jgi:hypothetical protein
MLHVDDSEQGTYEFGEVEGADAPVSANDQVAVLPIWTVPHVRVTEQALGDMNQLHFSQVLIDQPGWLVIHADADGSPGEVIGYAELAAGLNMNVTVEVDPAAVGNQVWAMLHADTGEAGVYEFGEVEGADAPVTVGDQVVVSPVTILPSEMEAEPEEGDEMGMQLDGDMLVNERCTVCHTRERIDDADKDRDGWASTVDRMIGYGAELNDQEREAVIDYLAETQ